ncbi:MAG: hypothetical protein K2N99_02400, partial [Malacoplasma sp.]|nr:hypothetical protein [Malacoplasma sp.]
PTDFSVAQDNLKRNLATPHALPYYEVTKLSGEKAKINPLNEKDINRLKDIALENAKNDANSFAIEDYFSNDGKTYRNIKNFNDYGIKNNKDNDVPNNFEDFLAKTLKTDILNFLKQIKISPSISTHTDYDKSKGDWEKFSDHISFNNNYSFYIENNTKESGKQKKVKDTNGKFINKIFGEKLDLFSEENNSLVLSDSAKQIDDIYKGFSNRGELNKNFNYENDRNNVFAPENSQTWHAGSDLILKKGTKLYDALKKFFYKESVDKESVEFRFELKIDTGIGFWKQLPSGIDQDYFFYKILEEPAKTKSNYWKIRSGRNSTGEDGTDFSNWYIYDTYSRQVYFKFQNILYFETSDSSKKIEFNNQLIDYFNEYMGINNNDSINKNNEVYKKIMQKFLINYFGVNESYKIDSLKKLSEYDDVVKLFEKGYKEIVENLKSIINENLEISGDNGISDVKQTFSYYSQGNYVNEKNDNTGKNTTIEKYTENFMNILNNTKKYDKNFKDIVGKNYVLNKISDWEEKSKKVITFNNKPLFFVNSNSKNSSDWTLKQLENISNRISILDAEKNSISIDLSSTNKKTWLDFSNWKTDFLNQLKNIDEDYQNIDFATLLSGIINSTPDKNEEIKQLEYNPGIFSAFYYYEKNLNLFTNSDDKKYSNLLENIVNRIDNLPFTLDKFVTLYANLKDTQVLNDNTFLNQLEPMYYGEYFGRITDFNESFDDVKLFYTNLKDKEEQLNKMNFFYPSQITYYV